ncbi:FAD binding domain-containing protein, partial [Gymnopilus junonius]
VAHFHSPVGGQGMNTAMQDVLNLTWKLVLVLKYKAHPSLFASYKAERMPVVTEMLNLPMVLHSRAFPHVPTMAFTVGNDEQEDLMKHSQNLLQLGINYH